MFELTSFATNSIPGRGATRSPVSPRFLQTHTWRKASPSTTASSSASTHQFNRLWGRSLVVSMKSADSDPGPTSQAAGADGAVLGSNLSASTAGELMVDATPEGGPGAEAGRSSWGARRIERLRISLLAALSSLDRGLAANAREAAEVDELCSQLESLGGPVTLSPVIDVAAAAGSGTAAGGSSAIDDQLAGTWRLIYSSGFNSGSLGGRRPGPPAALFPTILGQVYQRIDPQTAKLDNIVELLFSYGPPDLGLLSGLGEEALGRGLEGVSQKLEQLGVRREQLPAPLRDLLLGPEKQQQQQLEGLEAVAAGKTMSRNQARDARGGQERQGVESPAARLTLRHDYEVSCPATVRIVYEETYGELVGSGFFAQLPRLAAPSLPEPLRPPKFFRSATFEVTFLDAMMRITRGDRGELRVYLRDTAAEMALQGASGGRARETGSGAAALDYDD